MFLPGGRNAFVHEPDKITDEYRVYLKDAAGCILLNLDAVDAFKVGAALQSLGWDAMMRNQHTTA